MKKIFIKGEGIRWVADEREFAQILEEKLGYEAAELFREYISSYRYSAEEALEELERIDCLGQDEEFLDTAMAALRRVVP